MNHYNFRLKERLKFFLERQFIKGAHFQLLFVAALIGLISLVGGILVMPSGEPTNSMGEAIWWAFLRLSDPGYLGDDEGAWRRLISTILTVLGYVVFLGSLVAIITTWLNRKIRNLEQSLTPVTANNHVIILGWTNRTIHTAGEIFCSVGRLRRFLKFYGAKRLNIIILSEDVTPKHMQELRDDPLIGKRADEIILRSGIPIDREDLRRVDSLNAAVIIIPSSSSLDNEYITPDVQTIKTLLSLNAEVLNATTKKRFPYVVAEIQDDNKIKAAYRAYSGPLEVIGSNTIISRLLAQNIRHHGLSSVYNALLSRSISQNIFSREFSGAVGKTFHQLKPAFPKAILIGVVRVEQEEFKPILNVSADFRLEQGDHLVLVARNFNDIEMEEINSAEDSAIIQVRYQLKVEEQEGIIKILILGWNHHLPSLIRELCSYEDEYYHITIVAMYSKAERQKELEKLENLTDRLKWTHIESDYVRESELKKINPSAFDNILLVSSDFILEKEEADARTIVGYVLLEEVLEKAPKKPHILLELADPDNESLLRRYKSEVIISPLVLSNLLAGIALQREVNSIYKELFTVGGAEIIFRNPDEYGIALGTVTFREVENKAAEFGETALGLYGIKESLSSENDLILNPGRFKKLEITSSVRLVVLTTVY